MIINFNNVEKIVFQNLNIKKRLSDLNNLFYTYALSQQSPGLRPLGQKVMIEFLDTVKESHLDILRDYFKEEIIIEKINDNIKHYKFPIDQVKLDQKIDFLLAYREENTLYLSVW